MTDPGRDQAGTRRLSSPDSPAGPDGKRAGTELGQNGVGIRVSLGQPGQGKVFFRQGGERSPALTGPAAARKRQVQPTRPDSVREGRSRGGA